MVTSLFRSLTNFWTRLGGEKAPKSKSKSSPEVLSFEQLIENRKQLTEEIRLLREDIDKTFDL